ncbi:hypothetical protein D3C81_387050 [compost metagenome]
MPQGAFACPDFPVGQCAHRGSPCNPWPLACCWRPPMAALPNRLSPLPPPWSRRPSSAPSRSTPDAVKKPRRACPRRSAYSTAKPWKPSGSTACRICNNWCRAPTSPMSMRASRASRSVAWATTRPAMAWKAASASTWTTSTSAAPAWRCSTCWTWSSWRCCAARKVRCSARTPPPACSTSPRASPPSTARAASSSRLVKTATCKPKAASRGRSATRWLGASAPIAPKTTAM